MNRRSMLQARRSDVYNERVRSKSLHSFVLESIRRSIGIVLAACFPSVRTFRYSMVEIQDLVSCEPPRLFPVSLALTIFICLFDYSSQHLSGTIDVMFSTAAERLLPVVSSFLAFAATNCRRTNDFVEAEGMFFIMLRQLSSAKSNHCHIVCQGSSR